MIIYVLKNPDAATRAKCYSVPTPGAEPMEESEFIAWRDAQPEIVQASVPQVVPAWKLKALLQLRGLSAIVTAAILTLPEPQKTIATFAFTEGNEFHRGSVTTAVLQSILNKTDAEVDEIFTASDAIIA